MKLVFLIILLGVGFLMYNVLQKDKFDSYYDDGSWIKMPPQRARKGTTELYLPEELTQQRIYSVSKKDSFHIPGKAHKSALHISSGERVKVKPGILYEGYEPVPTNIPHGHTGDLCQECIGHCYIKIWAGVLNLPSNQKEKEFCISKCGLECVDLD